MDIEKENGTPREDEREIPQQVNPRLRPIAYDMEHSSLNENSIGEPLTSASMLKKVDALDSEVKSGHAMFKQHLDKLGKRVHRLHKKMDSILDSLEEVEMKHKSKGHHIEEDEDEDEDRKDRKKRKKKDEDEDEDRKDRKKRKHKDEDEDEDEPDYESYDKKSHKKKDSFDSELLERRAVLKQAAEQWCGRVVVDHLQEMSNSEIRDNILAVKRKSVRLDEHNESYKDACFDMLWEEHRQKKIPPKYEHIGEDEYVPMDYRKNYK